MGHDEHQNWHTDLWLHVHHVCNQNHTGHMFEAHLLGRGMCSLGQGLSSGCKSCRLCMSWPRWLLCKQR